MIVGQQNPRVTVEIIFTIQAIANKTPEESSFSLSTENISYKIQKHGVGGFYALYV